MAAREISVVQQKYQTGNGTDLFLSNNIKVEADANGKYVPGSAVTTLSLHNTGTNILGDVKEVATRGADGIWVLKKDGNGNPVAGLDLQKSLANRNSMLNINLNNHIKQSMGARLQGVAAGQVNNNTQQSVAAAIGIGTNTAAAAGSETPGGRNFDDDIKGSEKTRNKFPQNLIYPLKLAETKQDVIKFKMVKFQPRKFETTSTNLGGVAARTTGQIIGVVVLPIPNGISDSNTVNWNSGDMNAFDAFLANTALATIKDGFGAGAQVVQSGLEGASNNAGELGGGLKSAFAGLAIGQGGAQILQRTEGAILNPNMELLFNGPSLRPFTFSFKLASRSKEESEMIRKIIRFFKQGSAAQKSQSNLFLRAPHTFQIEYLHQGKPHNFLNQFKECALQSFGVSYTPEGQYATFQDGAMVSYQITMQFQELEPIFNEDYEGGIGDKATDTEIGY